MLDDQSQYVELVEPTDCYSLRGSVSERIPVQVGRPLNFEDWTVFQPGCAESERPTCGSQEGSIPWMLGWEWLTARMLKSSKCRQFKVNQDVPTSWTWQKGSGSQNVKIRNDWLHGCWKAVSADSSKSIRMFQLVGLDRKDLAVRMLRSAMTDCTDVEKQ